MINSIKAKPETDVKPIHRCMLCGKRGTDMVVRTFYVGGIGNVSQYECKEGC